MNILLIGAGGREHALAWKLARSRRAGTIFAAPGNAGIREEAECVALPIDDPAVVITFCKKNDVRLVVIGPEAPLVAGLADALADEGIATFGPKKAAARLEGSKSFTKDICRRYGIPTADYAVFDTEAAALAHLKAAGAPIVVKADGLAAGKGVIVATEMAQAEAAIRDIFGGVFGAAGAKVVLEEMLIGEEASFFALCDGRTALPLATAQDHKRAFDNDEGPNTGGMGAYSPAPVMTGAMNARVMDEIITPTLTAMAEAGTPYVGVLYAGLMITEDGPKLIEYNVRFGDPECQPLMMRLNTDLVDLMEAATTGDLAGGAVDWDARAALSVVMATRGYPGSYEKGSVIEGVERAAADDLVKVFHAGTSRDDDGALIATGGRVLNVTALGETITQAQRRAYEAVAKIDWPEGFHRTDIGHRAVAREREG
ncbi:MAG TPA: phosphoribosylamine--glycine ligase [Thermopetrobacter sp.]|nr:phosphoribosylamine--glycine ligase [Thermopetrobacter sp.]